MTKKRLRNTELKGILHRKVQGLCLGFYAISSGHQGKFRTDMSNVQSLFCAPFFVCIEALIPSGRLAGRDFYVTDKTVDDYA